MHILEIPSIFLPRGGRFCLDQAKALASHGHEVRILSCVEIGITEMPMMYMMLPYGTKWVVNEGIETLQFYSRRLPKYTRLNNRRWLNKVCSMFNTYVKRYGIPDVIHVHSVHWAGYAAFLIKKQWDVPYVITEHSSRAIFEMEFGKGVTDSWQIPLLKEALKNASKVIPVSDELVHNLKPLLGDDYSYTAISNTIDTDLYKPKERKYSEKYKFVYPAVFFPLKAHDTLLKAFSIVCSKLSNVELHLAGKGTDGKEIKELIKNNGIENKVHLHGQLSKKELLNLYYECNCLVHPSRSEAQPLVCLEAAATGIPFIATESIPKSLRVSPICPIVPIDEVDSLAKEMISMATNAKRFYPEFYDIVKSIASPEAFAQKFEEVLNEIKQ